MHNKIIPTFIAILIFVQCSYSLENDAVNFNQEYVHTVCDTRADCAKFGDVPCLEGQCRCQDGAHCLVAINNAKATVLGENCQVSDQCFIEGAICDESKVCSCPPHTIPATSLRKCLNATQDLNDDCEEDGQCKTYNKFGVCKNFTCVCQAGTHPSKGTCYMSSGLNGRCSRKEECDHINKTDCRNGICVCVSNFVSDSKTAVCLPTKKYGDSCEDDTQCKAGAGQSAQCSKNVCSCKDLYQYSDNLKRCIRELRLGEECQNHFDCHQPDQGDSRLMCVTGKCICKLQYFEEDGYCIQKGNYPKADLKLIFIVLLGLYFYM